MTDRRERGQAMVEMALGVALFLVATLAATQLGLSTFASEGVQSAALAGARAASAGPLPGEPLARLIQGQSAAVEAIRAEVLGLGRATACGTTPAWREDCGPPQQCVRYAGSVPDMGSLGPCYASSLAPGAADLGPAPGQLDGAQNPRCATGGCFGSAGSMRPCLGPTGQGIVRVCLAYTSWPPRMVDIWIRGTLRSVVPLVSSAGLDAVPVSVKLRLQVEGLTS